MLVGDAAGMVNPFNGEGIAYAMESGEIAARIVTQALAWPDAAGAERVLHGYPRVLADAYGGYYALGRAFVKAKVLNPVQVARDGAEALAYLSGEGKYANRAEYPLPALVLLDLRLPKMDGFEVLVWIRQQPRIASLRVVVLSGSNAMTDVNRAYRLGANSFLIKPVDFDRFVEVSQALSGYWIWMDQAPVVSRTATNAEIGRESPEVGGPRTWT